MVSGTFILTDTMQKSFDGLFAASYVQDRRGHQRQGDRQELHERRRRTIPAVAADEGPGPPRGRRGRWRRSARTRPTSPTSSARTARRSPARASAPAIDAAHRAVQPAASSRPAPGRTGPRRSSSTPAPPPRSTTRSATRHGLDARQEAHLRLSGTVSFGDRRLARLREHRGLGRQDRADGAAREGRYDSISIAAPRAPRRRSSCAPSSRSLPARTCRSRTATSRRRPTRQAQRGLR